MRRSGDTGTDHLAPFLSPEFELVGAATSRENSES